MKVFIAVLVLIFSFQSLTKADDISEFEIEGISIGDSLLDHLSKEEILNFVKRCKDSLYRKEVYMKLCRRYDMCYVVSFVCLLFWASSCGGGGELKEEVAENNVDISDFIKECKQTHAAEAALETMEKKGMPLGVSAIHPITGEKVPLWVANFVLLGYGTGAVMAVPGHDERDHEFANKYSLEIAQVVDGEGVDIKNEAYTGDGVAVNSDFIDGLSTADAKSKMIDFIKVS